MRTILCAIFSVLIIAHDFVGSAMAKTSVPQNVKIEKIAYRLGDTSIFLNRYTAHDGKGLTYFHPHSSEPTSLETSLQVIAEYGGVVVSFDNVPNRYVSFKLEGKDYSFDPNRIYTKDGVEDNLKLLGAYSRKAEDEVFRFSQWLSGVLSASRVFAIHNNMNKGYNVLSYRHKDGSLAKGVKAINIVPKNNTGNFVYTTNAALFLAAKESGFNAVLQGKDVVDDGSYSVFAMKKGIDYINVETQRTYAADDLKLIKFVNAFYNIPPATRSSWTPLKHGDLIDLVAPSSAYPKKDLPIIEKIFTDAGFRVRTTFAQQANDGLYHSNSDAEREMQFLEALNAPDSQAVWAIRGGGGSENFLTRMLSTPIPRVTKPLIGFSDVTGLHQFLNSTWNWPSIHGIIAGGNAEVDHETGGIVNSREHISMTLKVLTDDVSEVRYRIMPMNTAAKNLTQLETSLIGGNLTLLSNSLDTPFAPRTDGYSLILEDIGNSPHQLERLLDQILYSEHINNADAVILGEFLSSLHETEAETRLSQLVLERYAAKAQQPVFRLNRFGHGAENVPLPLNTDAVLQKKSDRFMLIVQNR